MWLYTFKSQFISVKNKVVTKGMIIKGVYYTNIQKQTRITHQRPTYVLNLSLVS